MARMTDADLVRLLLGGGGIAQETTQPRIRQRGVAPRGVKIPKSATPTPRGVEGQGQQVKASHLFDIGNFIGSYLGLEPAAPNTGGLGGGGLPALTGSGGLSGGLNFDPFSGAVGGLTGGLPPGFALRGEGSAPGVKPGFVGRGTNRTGTAPAPEREGGTEEDRLSQSVKKFIEALQLESSKKQLLNRLTRGR